MLINVWDAERLAGDGSSGNGPGKAIVPEPLQQLPTGAFHFCQFALTRWREEVAGKEEGGSSNGSGSGSAFTDSDVRRRETDDGGGHRESERQKQELRGGGGGDPAATATAPAPAPKSPTRPEEARGKARMEEPCSSDNSAFQENIMLAPCGEQHSVSKSLSFLLLTTTLCTQTAATSMTTFFAQCAKA